MDLQVDKHVDGHVVIGFWKVLTNDDWSIMSIRSNLIGQSGIKFNWSIFNLTRLAGDFCYILYTKNKLHNS